MEKEKKSKVAIYCRLGNNVTAFYCRSAVKDNQNIEKQKAQLIEYAENNGIREYKFYVDNGYSGTTLERPELTQLIEDVKSGIIDKVLTVSQDRFARDSILWERLKQIFKERGVAYDSTMNDITSEINRANRRNNSSRDTKKFYDGVIRKH